MGAKITNVYKNSPADKSGIQVGDELILVNSKPILDVLDYKFYAYDTNLTLEVKRNEQTYSVNIKKFEGEDLGLDFESYLIDKEKSCSNRCIFCFIDQNPRGMRKTIYFKDDDARLSFLLGNYITLTNLSDADVERIIQMKLSPINISVQTTNPKLREFMLGHKNAGESLKIIPKLALANIQMKCQVVVCQDVNDGFELENTIKDLLQYETVTSVSVVPAGLTKHRAKLHDLKPITVENANNIIDIVEKFAKIQKEKTGFNTVFCGDELYIRAKREFHPAEYYDDLEQFENGVGMISQFESEFLTYLNLEDDMPKTSKRLKSFTIATGSAMYPYMYKLIEKLKKTDPNIVGNVYEIENIFFGNTVSVAGLITGSDLIHGLKDKEINERIFITENMLKHGETLFLDDTKIEDVENALNRPIFTIANDGYELLSEIYRR
ncbi:MAG: DUF512 domain-containing protein [Clostridia bacterium]